MVVFTKSVPEKYHRGTYLHMFKKMFETHGSLKLTDGVNW